MNTELIEKLKEEIKEFFLQKDGCHQIDHTMRVFNVAINLGKLENADIEIVAISSLLHDIGRNYETESKGKICHAQKGAELAGKILEKYDYPNEGINQIKHCIETHRTKTDKKPETLEAKILYDADKLDSIGAIGLGRTFMYAQVIGAKLHSKEPDLRPEASYTEEDTAYREFILKFKDLKLYTQEGKKISKKRLEFMEQFFERLNQEIDGEI
ncbi:MAG: HD domain-containing protein [Candidatus Gracilibacteria bacterium]|nr:HD domain-containing protein [Candidatus Gracilibacteria bacterium]MDD3119963.1 HD domain-containing protein [Candidatus Gracilibacteria bacterium]MDD4529929.1 HD domain-containing protein [Candidatus Gracilibacteria bacterium]